MLTDTQLRKAFTDTNTAEPLAEGWPGLERFAREVERLTAESIRSALHAFEETQGEIHPGWNNEYFEADWVRQVARSITKLTQPS
jgi:hypothetical protein